MPVDLAADPLRSIIRRAPQLYMAVSGKDGPLVTPELHTSAAGRLWCLTARATAKARLLGDGDRVAVMLRGEGGSAVIGGRIERFDPMDPLSFPKKIGRVTEAGSGLARFLADNGYEMAGAAASGLTGRLGFPPAARLLLAIEPVWSAVTTGATGGWSMDQPPGGPSAGQEGGIGNAEPDVPPEIDAPDLRDGPVALGWTSTWGPLVVPAVWRSADSRASVDGELMSALGAPAHSPAAVCADTWTAPGPLGKHGTMHRGSGWLRQGARGDAQVDVMVDVDRVISWDGIDVTAANV